MPWVIFAHADGTRQVLSAPVGDSVMDCAVDNGVPGIAGQCGGGCTCATCHCRVDAAWVERLPPPTVDEAELLSFVDAAGRHSRLACRIVMQDAFDGLVVHILDGVR